MVPACLSVALILLADGVIERVFVKHSDLYAVYADGSKRLTADGRPKRFTVISPDGRRVAFVVEAGTDALGTLVVMSADGATAQETRLRPGEAAKAGAMKAIDELQWLTPDRLVVSGGFNAAAAEYVIVDANTGRELRSYFVRGFAWTPSPGGNHIAYEYYEGPRFCVDGDCRGADEVQFRWPAVWSEDGTQVAILEKYSGSRTGRSAVLVKRINERFDEVTLPFEAREGAGIGWDGQELILQSEDVRWKLKADRSEFVRAAK